MEKLADISWEEEHSIMHGVVDYLESKGTLTADEEYHLKESKKRRLYAKDRLSLLGR